MKEEKYILEYWIDLSLYNKAKLEEEISEKLDQIEVNIEIVEGNGFYILNIEGNRKNIDACHDKVEFEREASYRAKDELGDELRQNAYKTLAKVETELRKFISRAMIGVAGFTWWDQLIPDKLKKKAKVIEESSGKKDAKFHHPVEFTMFDGLIGIVTAEYAEWSEEKALTVSDLEELLDEIETIEHLKIELANKSKTISIWEDVFANYFDDIEAWNGLREKIKNRIIPIRNKVMHHRLLRLYEVKELEDFYSRLVKVLKNAKLKIARKKASKAFKNLSNILDGIRFQIDPEIMKEATRPVVSPEMLRALLQVNERNREIVQKFIESFEPPKLNLGGFALDNSGYEDDKNEDGNAEEDSDNSKDEKR